MNKQKIWVVIIGAGLVGAISAAIGFFPQLKGILAAVSSLITAIVTYLNGANNASS